jgi:alkanesulfonate monooxygenase SsuD/methylene tetrahydromethanopterin reductase-like flavin-dependent oxidoreductase (luciferase family)
VRVGVGLPGTIPGAPASLIVEWARRAEEGPFASLGVLDRILYDNHDPFTMLAAAAAVTSRVKLITMVVIAPIRNTAVLAKQAASIDAMSGGRLTLGLSIGARHDDFEAAAVDHRRRGERFDRQLAELRSIWEEDRIGPTPTHPTGPELLTGGSSGEAFGRMARLADGYVHGGGPPRAFAGAVSKAVAAWTDHERPGTPILAGQGYFALGDGSVETGASYLRDYYAFTGPFAEKIAAGNLTTPQAVIDFIRGYEEAGCDDLVLFPTVANLEQVDRLAEVLS